VADCGVRDAEGLQHRAVESGIAIVKKSAGGRR
jgi:hypothetical protein